VFLRHFVAKPFFQVSEPAAKKLAAGREAGKSRKRTCKKESLTGNIKDCIFCNNRKYRYDERSKKDERPGREK
jgi:hypothetical protein